MAGKKSYPDRNIKFSAYVPFKDGYRWEEFDYYGGLEDLRAEIIAELEKRGDRSKRVVIYYCGKKDGTLYYQSDKVLGGSYVYETDRFYFPLYKNGNYKARIPKERRSKR